MTCRRLLRLRPGLFCLSLLVLTGASCTGGDGGPDGGGEGDAGSFDDAGSFADAGSFDDAGPADDDECEDDLDCESGVCAEGECAAPTCDDGVKNGSEPGTDCGGPCSATCPPGEGCLSGGDCASGVCDDGLCLPPTCDDGVKNGDETEEDCGGSCAAACQTGSACLSPTDCESGVCADETCAAPACDDGVQNGFETDMDCGGICEQACPAEAGCLEDADCLSTFCVEGSCVASTCEDERENGFETGVDCGGVECDACPADQGCAEPEDCLSLVCTEEGLCAAATCDDEVQNSDETAVDCGGSCPELCAPGETCSEDGDCDADACLDGICTLGPNAGFTLDETEGLNPLTVTATSTATAGDAPLATVEYDFGDGDGFAAITEHTYEEPGNFEVRQRVTDENGLSQTTEPVGVSVTLAPCLLSATDKSDELVLTEDQLAVESYTLVSGAVRSTCSVGPGSGVFYFEGSIRPHDCDVVQAPEGCRRTPYEQTYFGVGTATVPFLESPGSSAEGFAVDSSGGFGGDSTYLGGFPREETDTYGIVVDYRGAAPVLHVLTQNLSTPAIGLTYTMTDVDEPVFAMVAGPRRKVGVQAQVNLGGDLTNRPFVYDPDALLRANGLSDAADALTLGFDHESYPPYNEPPELILSADVSVALGDPVTVTATATDDEEGDLSAQVLWEDVATVYNERASATGASWTYTPTQLGLHPLRATVVDSDGGRTQGVVRVVVTGALPQHDPVTLVNDAMTDPRVGAGVVTSPDGLSARWTAPDKMAVRANQGNLEDFWYFEFTRAEGPVNQGGGLVIWEGDLNPYSADNVPPSTSVNVGGATWQNIIYRTGFDNAESTYGFAVDYRGQNPIVYFIIGGAVVDEWTMYDVFVPVHPMLYGNPTDYTSPYDETINFGATPFVQDPCPALDAWGVDASALELGWGDAHATTSCP